MIFYNQGVKYVTSKSHFCKNGFKVDKKKLRQVDNSCIQNSIEVISFRSWIKDCC